MNWYTVNSLSCFRGKLIAALSWRVVGVRAWCVYGCRGEGQELKLGAQISVLGSGIQAAVDTNNKSVCYQWGLKALWECTFWTLLLLLSYLYICLLFQA